jgi:hypothetical protein
VRAEAVGVFLLKVHSAGMEGGCFLALHGAPSGARCYLLHAVSCYMLHAAVSCYKLCTVGGLMTQAVLCCVCGMMCGCRLPIHTTATVVIDTDPMFERLGMAICQHGITRFAVQASKLCWWGLP